MCAKAAQSVGAGILVNLARVPVKTLQGSEKIIFADVQFLRCGYGPLADSFCRAFHSVVESYHMVATELSYLAYALHSLS